ncbi:MAG TPA: hypothetical protein VFE05_14885 [Longimicrobiaceae bacterium]|jgi:hypothetical protein|nr:hypothetical protein [Longimicrobiaceae bacterium]
MISFEFYGKDTEQTVAAFYVEGCEGFPPPEWPPVDQFPQPILA